MACHNRYDADGKTGNFPALSLEYPHGKTGNADFLKPVSRPPYKLFFVHIHASQIAIFTAPVNFRSNPAGYYVLCSNRRSETEIRCCFAAGKYLSPRPDMVGQQGTLRAFACRHSAQTVRNGIFSPLPLLCRASRFRRKAKCF